MTSHSIDWSHPTINPGDRIRPNQTLEEKAQQIAVDAPDITGEHIRVPTYFIVEYDNGEKQALHHVRDAEAISDVVRQMQLRPDSPEETPDETPRAHHTYSAANPIMLLFILILTLVTVPILIGVF